MKGAIGRRGRGIGPGKLGSLAGRSVDLVAFVKDTAAEAVRTHRDPALVAQRRRVAAKRRVVGWSLAALVLAAWCTVQFVGTLNGDASATAVAGLVLMLAVAVYCVIGTVQAARDLRARTKIVRSLPPPQPARRAVNGSIRPLMARLDGYSDALRHGIGTIGAGPEAGDSSLLRQVRDDTLAAADAAETRLRQQASELSAMLRAATPPVADRVAATCAQLEHEIGVGVDEYGRLVVAAADAASASRGLVAAARHDHDVADATERLTALAAGMRELVDPPAPW